MGTLVVARWVRFVKAIGGFSRHLRFGTSRLVARVRASARAKADPAERLLRHAIPASWGLLLSIWVVRGAATWSLGLFNYLYYLPNIIFLPFTGLLAVLHLRFWPRQRWQVVLALAVVAGPLTGFCWGSYETEAGQFRVVTANVQSYTADLDAVGSSLAGIQADVLILQEVWTTRHLDVLKKHLPGYKFVQAGEFINNDYLEIGVFVGTRLPTTGNKTLDHGVSVDLTSPLGPIRVIGLHGPKRHDYALSDLYTTMELQRAQVTEVLTNCDRKLCIVGGDFNAPPSTPALKILRSRLTDSFAVAGHGYGLTFPAATPVWRLDQILHSPELRTVRAWTIWTGADHLGMVADYALASRKR